MKYKLYFFTFLLFASCSSESMYRISTHLKLRNLKPALNACSISYRTLTTDEAYKIFGFNSKQVTISREHLQQLRNTLIKKYHEDINPTIASAAKLQMQNITLAYDILMKDQKDQKKSSFDISKKIEQLNIQYTTWANYQKFKKEKYTKNK